MRNKIFAIGLIGVLLTAGLLLVTCGTMGGTGRVRTFTGEAPGYGGLIKVEVDVQGDKVVAVRVVESFETAMFAELPFERTISSVINFGSLNVDTVAGATFTSIGIRMAIFNALEKSPLDAAAMLTAPRLPFTPRGYAMTADVVVIGGGGAGLAAMAQASQLGASVIVLESQEILGGNTLLAGSIMQVAGNPNQVRHYGPNFDNAEWHARQTWDGGDRAGNIALIRTMTYNALDTANWLGNLGVRWADTPPHLGGGTIWPRTYNVSGQWGDQWISTLRRFADQPINNIQILMGTRGTELITDRGRVIGALAEDVRGNTYVIHARHGVVMATGGFSANVEMRMKYDELWAPIGLPLDSRIFNTNAAGLMGDGINMARNIGADLVDMGYIQLLPWANQNHPTGNIFVFLGPNQIKVNQEGRRFTNEFGRRDDMAKALYQQPNSAAFAVADGTRYNTDPVFAAQIDRWVRAGFILRGNTLAELAAQAGMPAAVFERTIANYNALIDNGGICPETGRNFSLMPGARVINPPFFFTPRAITVHHTMGGIKIDRHTRVIHRNGQPIPGFYAAGEVAGGIHARNRLGGNAVTDVFVFGRIAGRNVVLGENPFTGQNAAYFNAIPCVCRNLMPLPTGQNVTNVGPEFNPAVFQSFPDAIMPVCCR